MSVEHRHEEFAELERKALRALEEVGTPPTFSRPPQMVIQLWMYPAFADYVSWTLFTDKDGLNPVVRQVTWNRHYDVRRFTDPLDGLREGWHTEPTMVTEDAPLAIDEFLERMEAGRKIRIPLLEGAKTRIGLDGVRYGLQGLYGLSGWSLNWWEDGPEEWRELIKWAGEMRTYLSQAFARE